MAEDNDKRFVAEHPEDKPITIIRDSITDVPLITSPRRGFHIILNVLNSNAVKIKEKKHINVITVEAYRSGAVGEVEGLLRLIEKNRDTITISNLEQVLKERLKQLK